MALNIQDLMKSHPETAKKILAGLEEKGSIGGLIEGKSEDEKPESKPEVEEQKKKRKRSVDFVKKDPTVKVRNIIETPEIASDIVKAIDRLSKLSKDRHPKWLMDILHNVHKKITENNIVGEKLTKISTAVESIEKIMKAQLEFKRKKEEKKEAGEREKRIEATKPSGVMAGAKKTLDKATNDMPGGLLGLGIPMAIAGLLVLSNKLEDFAKALGITKEKLVSYMQATTQGLSSLIYGIGRAGLETLGKAAPAVSTGGKILSGVGKSVSKIAKFGGKFLGAAGALLDPAMALAKGENVGKESAGAVGQLGGMWGGAATGAAIGTALFPGVGTVVGGAIGGVGGSFLGEYTAEKSYDAIMNPKVTTNKAVTENINNKTNVTNEINKENKKVTNTKISDKVQQHSDKIINKKIRENKEKIAETSSGFRPIPAPTVENKVAEFVPDSPIIPAKFNDPKPNLSGKKYKKMTMEEQAKRILSEISEGEGTSHDEAIKRGYSSGFDIKFNYGEFDPKSDKKITEMTLDELDKFQTKMLQHPKNKKQSSASGKFQMTRSTIRDLRREFNLKGNLKFTPELQDKLAMVLLKRRGFDKFRSGKITADQFQQNLSKEWASVASKSGKSYYGQPIGTSKEELITALNDVTPTKTALNDVVPTKNDTGMKLSQSSVAVAENERKSQPIIIGGQSQGVSGGQQIASATGSGSSRVESADSPVIAAHAYHTYFGVKA
jgi:hypothetical protein